MSVSFPKNPSDGMLFERTQGDYYQYDGRTKSWVHVPGLDKQFELATPLKSGLMSSGDFEKLQGLLIPPPRTSLTTDDCKIKFERGIYGFRSSTGDLDIQYERTLVDKDEQGFPVERRAVWKIHENTYGIDFRVNVDDLIEQLEGLGQLTYRKSIGPQGERGDDGEDGEDRIESGPKGEIGESGVNAPFPGSLSREPRDFVTAEDNRGVVDLRIQRISPSENYLVATRGNLGDPDFCPKFVESENLSSKWVVAIDDTPASRQILTECEKEICGVRNCTRDITTTRISQVFCSSRLFYIDMTVIEDRIFNRFMELLLQMKETKEAVVNEYLGTLIRVYNEQKQSLCCAIENCESKRENARERRRIEDINVHAARDGLGIRIDGQNARQNVETNVDKDCPEEDNQADIPQDGTGGTGGTGSGGTAPVEYVLTINCRYNDSEENAANIEVPAGTYRITYTNCCCYEIPRQPLLRAPNDKIALSRYAWGELEDKVDSGDLSNFGPDLKKAALDNRPYSGEVTFKFSDQSDPSKFNDKKVSSIPSAFRTSADSEEYFIGLDEQTERIIGEGDVTTNPLDFTTSGEVRAWYSGLFNSNPFNESLDPPSAREGEIVITLIPQESEEPPVTDITDEAEPCTPGAAAEIEVTGEENTLQFTPFPKDPNNPNKVLNPFEIDSTDPLQPIILELGSGKHLIEITDACCIFDNFATLNNTGSGGALIITQAMHSAAVAGNEDEFVERWRTSKIETQHLLDVYPFTYDARSGKAEGYLNDLGEIERQAIAGQLPGFVLDTTSLFLKAGGSFRPYSGVVTIVYRGVEPQLGFAGSSWVAIKTLKDDDTKNYYIINDDWEAREEPILPVEGFKTNDEARAAYIGRQFQINAVGGQVAIFFDDVDSSQAFTDGIQTVPTLNTGNISVKVSCIDDTPDCVNGVMDIEVDCFQTGGGTVQARAELEVGSYVAQLVDCCCGYRSYRLGQEDLIPYGYTGFFHMQYNRFQNLPTGTPLSSIGTKTNVDLGQFETIEEAFSVYEKSTIGFSHAGGEIRLWVDYGSTDLSKYNQRNGKLTVRIFRSECFNTQEPEDPNIPVDTGDDTIGSAPIDPYNPLADFSCDLGPAFIRSLNQFFKNNSMCYFIAESEGLKYVVVRGSVSDDGRNIISDEFECKASFSRDTECIRESLDQVGLVTAWGFPTLDGKNFAGFSGTTTTRMISDPDLQDILLSKLAALDVDAYFTARPSSVVRSQTGVVSRTIIDALRESSPDAYEQLLEEARTFSNEFEMIVFPYIEA